MKEKLNSTCSICGERYHVCVTCSETKSFTPWRTIVDTINCYKIFLIIRDYTNKNKTKEEAKVELEKCDLSNMNSFLPGIKLVIKEILKVEKKAKKVSLEEDAEEQ